MSHEIAAKEAYAILMKKYTRADGKTGNLTLLRKDLSASGYRQEVQAFGDDTESLVDFAAGLVAGVIGNKNDRFRASVLAESSEDYDWKKSPKYGPMLTCKGEYFHTTDKTEAQKVAKSEGGVVVKFDVIGGTQYRIAKQNKVMEGFLDPLKKKTLAAFSGDDTDISLSKKAKAMSDGDILQLWNVCGVEDRYASKDPEIAQKIKILKAEMARRGIKESLLAENANFGSARSPKGTRWVGKDGEKFLTSMTGSQQIAYRDVGDAEKAAKEYNATVVSADGKFKLILKEEEYDSLKDKRGYKENGKLKFHRAQKDRMVGMVYVNSTADINAISDALGITVKKDKFGKLYVPAMGTDHDAIDVMVRKLESASKVLGVDVKAGRTVKFAMMESTTK